MSSRSLSVRDVAGVFMSVDVAFSVMMFSLYIRYICVAAYGVSRGCGCGGCGNDTLLQGDGDAIPRAYLRSIV